MWDDEGRTVELLRQRLGLSPVEKLHLAPECMFCKMDTRGADKGVLYIFSSVICFVAIPEARNEGIEDFTFTFDLGDDISDQDTTHNLTINVHMQGLQSRLSSHTIPSSALLTLDSASGEVFVFTGLKHPDRTHRLISFLARGSVGKLGRAEQPLWRDRDEEDLPLLLSHGSELREMAETFQINTVLSSGAPGQEIERMKGYWGNLKVRAALTSKSWRNSQMCVTQSLILLQSGDKKHGLSLEFEHVVVVAQDKKALTIRTCPSESQKETKIQVVFDDDEVMQDCVSTVRDTWYLHCWTTRNTKLLRSGRRQSVANVNEANRNDLLVVLRRLHLHFASLDSARNGWVLKKDFHRAIEPLIQSANFAEQFFRIFDVHKKGAIRFMEFVWGMGDMVIGTIRDQLTLSFRLFDRNGDGVIDEEEFLQALQLLDEINPVNLHDEYPSLDALASHLFDQISTVKPPSGGRNITLEEYQQGMLCNVQLHQAFEPLAHLVVDWTGNFPGNGTRDSSTLAQTKAKAGKFLLFGNKDWELASHILHGIKKATAESEMDAVSEESSYRHWLESIGNTCELRKWVEDKSRVKHYYVSSKSDRMHRVNKPPKKHVSACCGGEKVVTFTNYAPQVFRRLRSTYGVSKKEYLHSLGIDNMIFNLLFGSLCTPSQMSSSGQSGSFFFLSHDARYILKSLPVDEKGSLLAMLPDYFVHMKKHPDSLLTRFCGLYAVAPPNGPKVTFVAMANIFSPQGRTIKQLYDLKGSTVNRTVQGPRRDVALKDLDLNRTVKLRWDWRQRLLHQVQLDSDFLESMEVIDYSFLLGIDSKQEGPRLPPKDTIANQALKELKLRLNMQYAMKPFCASCTLKPKIPEHNPVLHGEDYTGAVPDTASDTCIPLSKCPAAQDSVFHRHYGGIPTHDNTETVFVGIIDILTRYSWRKVAEHRMKRVLNARMRMSCVPHQQYRARFINFLESVLVPPPGEVTLFRLPSRAVRFRALCEAGLTVDLVLVAQPPKFVGCSGPALLVVTSAGAGYGTVANEQLDTRLMQEYREDTREELVVVRAVKMIENSIFSRCLSLHQSDVLVVTTKGGDGPLRSSEYKLLGGVAARLRLLAAIHHASSPSPTPSRTSGYIMSRTGMTFSVIDLQQTQQLDSTVRNVLSVHTPSPLAVIVIIDSRKTDLSATQLGTAVNSRRANYIYCALRRRMATTHHLVAAVNTSQSILMVLATHPDKVTEVRSAYNDEVEGMPVAVGLVYEMTPVCVVSTGALSKPQSYADVVRFVSRGLRVDPELDINSAFSVVVWACQTLPGQGIALPRGKVRSLVAEEDYEEIYKHDRFANARLSKLQFAGYQEAIPPYPPRSLGDAPSTPYGDLLDDFSAEVSFWPDRVLWHSREGNALELSKHHFMGFYTTFYNLTLRSDVYTPFVRTPEAGHILRVTKAAVRKGDETLRSVSPSKKSVSSELVLSFHAEFMDTEVVTGPGTTIGQNPPSWKWEDKEIPAIYPLGHTGYRLAGMGGFLEKQVLIVSLRTSKDILQECFDMQRPADNFGQGVLSLSGLLDGEVYKIRVTMLDSGVPTGFVFEANIQLLPFKRCSGLPDDEISDPGG